MEISLSVDKLNRVLNEGKSIIENLKLQLNDLRDEDKKVQLNEKIKLLSEAMDFLSYAKYKNIKNSDKDTIVLNLGVSEMMKLLQIKAKFPEIESIMKNV